MELITLGFLLVLVSTLTLLLVLHVRHMRKCNVPGPRPYPIIGNLPKYLPTTGSSLPLVKDLFEKYPKMFVLWYGPLPVVFFNDPIYIEAILNGGQCNKKPSMYRFMKGLLGEGILISNGEKWQRHRTLINPTFHLKILENFVEVFSEISEKLVQRLDKEVGGDGFDAMKIMKKCTVDLICETAMGYKSNCLELEGESEYNRAIDTGLDIILRRFINPLIHLDFIFYKTPLGKKFYKCCKAVSDLTDTVIRNRVSNKQPQNRIMETGKKKRKAFLDMLLEIQESGMGLSDAEIREEVNTFIGAGHDTSAVTLAFVLFNLGHHPDIQDKVYKELQSIFQGSDRAPSMKDLSDMKYMEMVIKESLRLYSTAPGFARVAEGDVRVGPYTIPSGAYIMVLLYFVGRNAEYHPDPLKFDPDRFLPERVANRHPYAYIPFSAGPRNCIGSKFAMLEMKTVLSYIFRKFTVRSLTTEVYPEPLITLHVPGGIHISVSRRRDIC